MASSSLLSLAPPLQLPPTGGFSLLILASHFLSPPSISLAASLSSTLELAYGMELLRKMDFPEYKCTTAIMGYGPEDNNAVIELTYNYGVKEYDKGNGYGQIAIGTDNVYKTAEAVKLNGGKIVLDPGPLPGINTKITACLDPDGWKTVFVDNIDFLKELE